MSPQQPVYLSSIEGFPILPLPVSSLWEGSNPSQNLPMKLIFRALVTALMFALIFRTIDVGQVLATLQKARPELLAVAIVLQFASLTLAAYRWYLVMQNLNFGQSVRFYWRSYLKGMFFNQGLPTSVGGDALRVLDVARQGFRKRDAFYGVFLDRVIGVAALMLVNLVALLLVRELLPRQITYLIALVAAGGLAGFVVAFLPRQMRWLELSPNAWLLRVRGLSVRLHQVFQRNRLQIIVWSLLIHLLGMLCIFSTGWALGLRFGLLTYLVIVPPVLLFTLIPVSLAGWGVREGAMVALFSFVGADKAAVLTMSVLYGVILIVVSLPGLAVYLHGHRASTLEPGNGS